MTQTNEALRLARQLVALRQAAEVEVRENNQMLIEKGHKPLTNFEKELIRTAFKGGVVYGTNQRSDLPKV